MVRDVLERERKTLVVNDVQSNPRLDGAGVKRAGGECLVLLPLIMGDEFVGALLVARMQLLPFRTEGGEGPRGRGAAGHHRGGERARFRRDPEAPVPARGREPRPAGGGRRHGGGGRDHRGVRGASRSAGAGLARRGDRLDRADHGRDRHRQGARRSRDPRGVAARQARAGQGQLRRAARGTRRVRAVRPREGRLHRRAGDGGRAASSWRPAARSSSTRWGSCRPPVQVALLRVLQEREFERVGGHETLRTDARVVAATNRNLEEAVREGRFRADLFYRLNVFPIRVPPLRERAEDIPLLAEYWASQYARKVGKAIRGIDESAMTALCAYPWPGNIRELQNVVERAVILARGSVLELSDFELPGLGSEPRRTRCARRSRRRAPADRGGPGGQPRPRLRRRRGGGGARRAAQHAGVAHPSPRDRQARLPPSRLRPPAVKS